MADLHPFRLHIEEARLEALRRAVAAFDWDAIPELVEGGDPWSAGASLAFMRRLCDHWVRDFDWRAQEAAINRYPQFIARLDGQDIHLLHERGSGPHDTALVLTHGWPGSIVEFLPVIDRLAHPERFGGAAADGIDVVVPALPGFGCSGRPAAPIGPRAIAGLWDRLLRETLGYRRYVAQGGDWGAMVSAMLGLHHGAAQGGGCAAIHLNYLGVSAALDPADELAGAFLRRGATFLNDGRAYSELHRTRPQTFAYATAGNPVGEAAWIVDKFHAWCDLRHGGLEQVIGLDTLLANVFLYVATGAFSTATWIYRAAASEGVRVLPPGERVAVPTGFASFPMEIRPRPPRGLVERSYHVVRFSEFDRGGHFAALEQPEAFAADVAGFLGDLWREGVIA
jgi:microsomal epoxide hydrolase